jgi:hypothetical protein
MPKTSTRLSITSSPSSQRGKRHLVMFTALPLKRRPLKIVDCSECVQRKKCRCRMSELGQTRSFGDVCSMSGSRHGTCTGTAPTCRSDHPRHSPNGTLWSIRRRPSLVRLDAGKFHHLGPPLGFGGD